MVNGLKAKLHQSHDLRHEGLSRMAEKGLNLKRFAFDRNRRGFPSCG
jgi:hypothetical protein